jgi:hypothetical protein
VDWLVEANVSEKRTVSIFRASALSPHGVQTQKNIINIVTAVKTSTLI